jgi:hypothetical protein
MTSLAVDARRSILAVDARDHARQSAPSIAGDRAAGRRETHNFDGDGGDARWWPKPRRHCLPG